MLAVDADPNSSLAPFLGFGDSKKIIPISEMKDLIYERMGVDPKERASFYKLNPKIDDIPDRFKLTSGRVSLIVMGTVDAGGSGCVCPESKFLKELISHLVLERDEDIVMDMEAGLEHLGRATAGAMDSSVVVVEPSFSSVETALRIKKLASDIRLKAYFLGNKTRSAKDEDFIYSALPKDLVLGMVPYDEDINSAGRDAAALGNLGRKANRVVQAVSKIKEGLLNKEKDIEQKKIAG